MDVLDDAPDVSFELHDQIVKTIKRPTAKQGFNLGTRSSDHTINSLGHGKFDVDEASQEFESISLAVRRVDDIDVCLGGVKSHSIAFPSIMNLGARDKHISNDVVVVRHDGERLRGR